MKQLAIALLIVGIGAGFVWGQTINLSPADPESLGDWAFSRLPYRLSPTPPPGGSLEQMNPY